MEIVEIVLIKTSPFPKGIHPEGFFLKEIERDFKSPFSKGGDTGSGDSFSAL
jgi:hypothetical protein